MFRNTTWNYYSTPKPNYISSFIEFAQYFIVHFVNSRKLKKAIISLLGVEQKIGESLRNIKIQSKVLKIVDVSITDPMQSLVKGLKERLL